MARRQVRCAIYTRKSTEEGLDQEYNTLDAQRDACEAYIRSQASEGWKALPARYDDGGYSGGNTERPALQTLMADIRDHRVDVIVVYKIDRLTRSLSDFAKLADLLDDHDVSFVSVTQQFNTTTSMGRLTLNMLLSFAQFEREVTGERIRDKIAASKKKGLWMGGTTPIGYRVEDRRLVIIEEDADIVRSIFRLYLELGTVRQLKQALQERGIVTKKRELSDGRITGGQPYQRGHLYQLLSNPVYIGHIPHREESYPGSHTPIIDQATWEAVQKQLGDNRQGHRRKAGAKAPSLLAGVLEDDQGHRFTPSHATTRGRRYRYYVEQTKNNDTSPRRLPALEIEAAVRREVQSFVTSPQRLVDALGHDLPARHVEQLIRRSNALQTFFEDTTRSQWMETVRPLLRRVVLSPHELRIEIAPAALRTLLRLDDADERPHSGPVILTAAMEMRCRGSQLKIVIRSGNAADEAKPDMALIKAVARAHDWFEQLATGEVRNVLDIAKEEGLTRPYVSRVMKLAFLAPELVEAILDGGQPADLTVDEITLGEAVPAQWEKQAEALSGSRRLS